MVLDDGNVWGLKRWVGTIIPTNNIDTLGESRIDLRIFDSDYWRMIRARDWICFYPLFPLAGALLAGASPSSAITVMAAYLPLIAYAFAVNNYFDTEIDRYHLDKVIRGVNPLASGSMSRKDAALLLTVLVFLNLAGACIVANGHGNFTAFIMLAINLLLVTVYSGGIRLKERPGLDVICHGLMFGGLPLTTGYIMAGGDELLTLMGPGMLATLLGGEALLAHQIVDYTMDQGHTTTTVTLLGSRWGIVLLAITAIASLGILAWISIAGELSQWITAILAIYLFLYPVHSCRIFRRWKDDLGHYTGPQREEDHMFMPSFPR